jgi:hypothetical protein
METVFDDVEALLWIRGSEPLKKRNREAFEEMEGIRIERAGNKSTHCPGKN